MSPLQHPLDHQRLRSKISTNDLCADVHTFRTCYSIPGIVASLARLISDFVSLALAFAFAFASNFAFASKFAFLSAFAVSVECIQCPWARVWLLLRQ